MIEIQLIILTNSHSMIIKIINTQKKFSLVFNNFQYEKNPTY